MCICGCDAYIPPVVICVLVMCVVKEIVEYQRPSRRNLVECDGMDITILEYRVVHSTRYGSPMAVIKAVINGRDEELYTFSRVVIRQLEEEIAPILRQGKVVKVKVSRDPRKRYLVLMPPSR